MQLRCYPTKIAIFTTPSGERYEIEIIGNCCVVPWEVLRGESFTVGVVGLADASNPAGAVINTNTVTVPLVQGVLTDETTPQYPTETIIDKWTGEQLESMKEKLVEAVNRADETLNATTNDTWDELFVKVEQVRLAEVSELQAQNYEYYRVTSAIYQADNMFLNNKSVNSLDIYFPQCKSAVRGTVSKAVDSLINFSYNILRTNVL